MAGFIDSIDDIQDISRHFKGFNTVRVSFERGDISTGV